MKKVKKIRPSVAVIVLNFNGRSLLSESLGSLSRQTYPNYNLYLFDDCSTDDSIKFVQKKFPKVRIIKPEARLGITKSSNLAVARTKEPLVVLVSNDMKFDKHCVSELVKTISEDTKVGVCTSVLVKHDPDPKTRKYYLDNAGGDLDIYGFGMPHDNEKSFEELPKRNQEVFFSYGGSFIVKRSVFNKVGGFDELFWGLSDDIDLSWRIRLLGYKVVVNPKSFLYHHISPTLGQNKRSKNRYFSERNSFRMLLKNYSLSSLIAVLPRYLFLEIGEAAFFFLRGRYGLAFSIVKAFGWNFINLPSTLQQRRQIQASRLVEDSDISSLLSHKSYKLSIFLPSLQKGII